MESSFGYPMAVGRATTLEGDENNSSGAGSLTLGRFCPSQSTIILIWHGSTKKETNVILRQARPKRSGLAQRHHDARLSASSRGLDQRLMPHASHRPTTLGRKRAAASVLRRVSFRLAVAMLIAMSLAVLMSEADET